MDTWNAMENLVDMGLVRSIGVSNFNSEQIDRLYQLSRIKPVRNQFKLFEYYLLTRRNKFLQVTNQIECCPTLNQRKLIQFCKERDVVVVAYCPFRHLVSTDLLQKLPNFLQHLNVLDIAEKYNKTPAQIVLRYLVILTIFKAFFKFIFYVVSTFFSLKG